MIFFKATGKGIQTQLALMTHLIKTLCTRPLTARVCPKKTCRLIGSLTVLN